MVESVVRFETHPLPAFLRVPNRVMGALPVAFPRLTPERLTASAARAAGLPNRFPSVVERSLEVLCRSIEDEAKLHWFGRTNLELLIVTGLSSLLQVEQQFRDDPTLADSALVPPVIVTGLPRSGTTYLHRLLCASQDAASVALYQHVYPVPRRPLDLRQLDFRSKFEPWKHASRPYNMDAMHLMRPELPDECNWGMRLSAQSMIFWNAAPVYSYLRWLLDQDLRETYALYRKVLLVHQREMPGRRITLKCPHHLAWLPALTEAIPEARVVEIHRDPLETVASDAKLSLSMHAMATPALDARRSVEHVVLKNERYAEVSLAFSKTPAGAGVHHVDYRRLVRDPIGLARDIHAALELPFTSQHEAALRSFAENNKQHKHGRNPYTLAQFGLQSLGSSQVLNAYRAQFFGEPSHAEPKSTAAE
jgi:hypothetical protein